MPTHRLTEDQAVEGRHALYRRGADTKHLCNGANGTIRHPAVSALDDFQGLNARGLRLLVVPYFFQHRSLVRRMKFESVGADKPMCLRCCCHHQRSTSAITKSILPRWAIRSGTKPPRITAGICCRCGKLGVRMRVR